MNRCTRRQFVKGAVAVGVGVSGFPLIFVPRVHAAWQPKTPVHPNIDNLRVVTVTDDEMISGQNPDSGWLVQDRLVKQGIVWENLDKLACGLTERRTPEKAWKTIFIRPPGKSWSDTVVAIKTNNLGQQHTHSAVMAKICQALTTTVGVPAGNIHIYDASHGSRMQTKSPFKGLPRGCGIKEEWGGISTETAIMSQFWKGSTKCLEHLAKGSVDILINVSMCKGHSSRFGGFTMTLKNHLGTFSPWPAHSGGGLDYLLAINQSPEILGAMDKKTGRVLFPRQQLCIVDALWSSKGGPNGNPTHQTGFLAMGVLSPAVDYQVATHFRSKRMGWRINKKAAGEMLTAFGYGPADLPSGGRFIEV